MIARRRASLCLLAASLTVVACGGSSSEGSTTPGATESAATEAPRKPPARSSPNGSVSSVASLSSGKTVSSDAGGGGRDKASKAQPAPSHRQRQPKGIMHSSPPKERHFRFSPRNRLHSGEAGLDEDRDHQHYQPHRRRTRLASKSNTGKVHHPSLPPFPIASPSRTPAVDQR